MENLINGLPGENPGYIRPYEPSGKKAFFQTGDAWRIPPGTPEAIQAAWRKEYELCNCSTCYDTGCKHRNTQKRLPLDVGGQDQCLRLMQSKTRYTWRNGNGDIITIPAEVVKAIHDQ